MQANSSNFTIKQVIEMRELERANRKHKEMITELDPTDLRLRLPTPGRNPLNTPVERPEPYTP
jgi:hypothetical protein